MHAHGDEHARLRADRRALSVALALIAAFLVVEVVVGLLADSLAVLADAGHMLSDAGSLALALFAAWLAVGRRRPSGALATGGPRSWRRLRTASLLVVVAIWIFVAAARRFSDPPEVAGGWVLAVGVIGLAVNLLAAGVLHRGGSSSLNVRAALLHVLADLLGSVGVIVAGLVVLMTGWELADPLVALLIARPHPRQLLAAAQRVRRHPARGDAGGHRRRRCRPDDRGVPKVVEVHDLHVWTITSGFPALSAHVLVEPGADCHAIRRQIEGLLRERFALEHTTLQVDHAGLATTASVELRRS